MAEELDDGEFWLPPQFLADDDDVLMDFRNAKRGSTDKCFSGENDGGLDFAYGFDSFGRRSDLGSPVESVAGSTETESDEEDYLAGLTQQMVHFTFHDDMCKTDCGLNYEKTKSRAMSGSPQSTLCNALGGCGCMLGSSGGSPNRPLESSPRGFQRNEASLDHLYTAAGEVTRTRMLEVGAGFYHQSRDEPLGLGPPRNPAPASPLQKNLFPNFGHHSNHSISYKQLQAAQFHQLKQQQMKQQVSALRGQSNFGVGQFQRQQSHQAVQNRARNSNDGHPLGLSTSAWPTLQHLQHFQQQHQPRSRMRAVFLGSPASKRESTGTGVFLPRRTGTPTETRKKPGCSTVLLPERVVHALNLNLKAMDAPPLVQPRYDRSFNPDYDATLESRNNFLMAHQRHNVSRPDTVMNNEARLPQEWTY